MTKMARRTGLAAMAMACLAAGCVLHAPDKLPSDADADLDLDLDTDGMDGVEGTDSTDSTDTGDVYVEPDGPTQDQDGDTIEDIEEGCGPDIADANGDTLINQSDWLDTDGDGTPDCLDLDSDDDCMPDAEEAVAGIDRQDPDTDGDGWSDFVEVTVGTIPSDPTETPSRYGVATFVSRYEAAPSPAVATLVSSADVRMLDVFFLVDTSASMAGEIDALTGGFGTTLVPLLRSLTPSAGGVTFGVGSFKDYPVDPYGDPTDTLFAIGSTITEDDTQVQAAIDNLVAEGGGDVPDGAVPALWVTATGEALAPSWVGPQTCPGEGFGYPCFRQGAMTVIALITDAQFHNGPADSEMYSGISLAPPTFVESLSAVNSIAARVVAVVTDPSAATALAECTYFAGETLTLDSEGNPIVRTGDIDGSNLVTELSNALDTLVTDAPFPIVELELTDDPTDGVNAIAAFVDHVEANVVGGVTDPRNTEHVCVAGLEVADMDFDTHDDAFLNLPPGTVVCFDIVPRTNHSVPAETSTGLFLAHAQVKVLGVILLDEFDVAFIVPPSSCTP